MVQLVSSHGKTLKVVPSLPSGEPGLHDGISARLWAATSALAQESMSTPFVTGIADGTLPRLDAVGGRVAHRVRTPAALRRQ